MALAEPPATDDATIHRKDLSTLGPSTWAPFAAEPFTVATPQGKPWSLADHKGKNVVVLFFLGGKCAHCMQQLQVFSKEIEALKSLKTDLVALSTDDLDATKALMANPEGIKFTMPLLPNPELGIFKAYHAFDDFEGAPLHGTFLIDAGVTSATSGFPPTPSWTSTSSRPRPGESTGS